MLSQLCIPIAVCIGFLAMTIMSWMQFEGDKIGSSVQGSVSLFLVVIGIAALVLDEIQRRANIRKQQHEKVTELHTSSNAEGHAVTDAEGREVKDAPVSVDVEKGCKPDSVIANLAAKSESAKANAEPAGQTEKPKGKSNMVYLMNLKTFLTFIVVTHHCVCAFSVHCNDGMGTEDAVLVKQDGKYVMERNESNTFMWGALSFMASNQAYFMSAFFLISGLFAPKSLDRKGFARYIKDKFVRLGGPFLLVALIFYPLLYLWCYAYAGYPLKWNRISFGPLWFVFWLLIFSCLYALIAQVMPVIKMRCPNPILLSLCGFPLGLAWYGLQIVTNGAWWGGIWWSYAIPYYIPFFVGGVMGGRNGWLKDIEQMSNTVVWTLRAYVLLFICFLFGFICTEKIGSQQEIGLAAGLIWCGFEGVYAIAITLAEIQFFHQYLNQSPPHWLAAWAGKAAYTVYAAHAWFINISLLIFIEILKAAGTKIIFAPAYELTFLMVDSAGEPQFLSQGCIWGGFFFVLVLTQLMVWPFSHYFRQLPILREMF